MPDAARKLGRKWFNDAAIDEVGLAVNIMRADNYVIDSTTDDFESDKILEKIPGTEEGGVRIKDEFLPITFSVSEDDDIQKISVTLKPIEAIWDEEYWFFADTSVDVQVAEDGTFSVSKFEFWFSDQYGI